MGDVIKDFYKSDAPQFKGRSKEKRREMAIAAKLTAERGPQNEAATEVAMSPAELALQKKKTMIDKMITMKRQQALGKTKTEEVEVDEAMRPGPRREKMRAKMHDPYVRGGSKSRGQAHNIAVRGDVSTADPAIKSRGGGGVEKDKGMGYGDRGAGNKARRRAGQEPMRGNTRTEEVEVTEEAPRRPKNAYPANLRAKTMMMSKADRQKHFDKYDAENPYTKKEELEATGLFSDQEIDAILEAMSSYDRNRKRAAERAAARNAARDAGKTGVVPGVGYVTPRREKETYVDSAGTTRHKSGAKMP